MSRPNIAMFIRGWNLLLYLNVLLKFYLEQQQNIKIYFNKIK